MTYQATLRERLIARNNPNAKRYQLLEIPVVGRIEKGVLVQVNVLAQEANSGDPTARDVLWASFKPRLERRSWVLKPWPNTSRFTGIWDRDDVRQESWVVFAELLAAWDGEVSFVPYLLARFNWRLRDRILRGIGKRQNQFGSTRVSEDMLNDLLYATVAEQPESVAIARKLLEELLKRFMTSDESPDGLDAWVHLINSPESMVLVSPVFGQHEPPDVKRMKVA